MRVRSVKKAVAQRGWNPLNMNCLYHPDIITTKVSGDGSADLNRRSLEMERNILRNDTGVSMDLTEADVRAASDGPGAIKEFNWKGNITTQVFKNCNQRLERYTEQEAEIEQRRVERREQGVQQLNLFTKHKSRLSSGVMYFEGVASVNHPQFINALRQKLMKQQRASYQKECKEYVIAKKRYEEGKLLLAQLQDAEHNKTKYRLTNATLQKLICWKWSAQPKHERNSLKQLKGKNKIETRNLKLSEWQKWRLRDDLFPSLIPVDFQYYDDGDANEEEDGQEQNVEFKRTESMESFDSLQSAVEVVDDERYEVALELMTIGMSL